MPSSPQWPRLVAEALRRTAPPPPSASLPPEDRLSAWSARDLLRRVSDPPRSADPAPGILRAHQIDPWRRAVAALRTYRAAVLLEEVGVGKTWIALAVAASVARRAVVIVPAVLQPQWKRAMVAAGLDYPCWTHERLSRGRCPTGNPDLVILDECHHFRSASTRRIRTLAPWLRGRQVLGCTATPIVNRLDDLLTLLQLMAPLDLFHRDGLRRLTDLTTLRYPPLLLRRVLIRTTGPGAVAGLSVSRQTWRPSPGERARIQRAEAAVEPLGRADPAGVSTLIRGVFHQAAQSSDAALLAALQRYRLLLLHAQEAGGISRAALHRFTGPQREQLVLWELMPAVADGIPLPLEDLPRVADLIAVLRGDPLADQHWIAPLEAQLADGVPTVCFSRYRATVHLLRRVLGEGTAWITGHGAGIGRHRLPRQDVLRLFGPGSSANAPPVLIATDVAAEGLDLQRAGRVIHVDLPWTATGLFQREGRLLRPGQTHSPVITVRRQPPSPTVPRTTPLPRITDKAALARRWLDALALSPDPEPPSLRTGPGVPVLRGAGIGAQRTQVVLGVEGSGTTHLLLVSREGNGPWRVALPEAHQWPPPLAQEPSIPLPAETLRALLTSASAWASAWLAPTPSLWCPALGWRLQHLAQTAARQRDGQALQRLDALLTWARTPPTLADRWLADTLAAYEDDALLRATAPPLRPDPGGAPRLTPWAVILYRSDAGPLRCSE